jgi:hypothetical protein
MSLFAPQSKQEVATLLKYTSIAENRQAIEERFKNPAYIKEIQRLREYHRKLYTQWEGLAPINPDADSTNTVCPWERWGLTAECDKIAEQFSVPAWRVSSHANSYTDFAPLVQRSLELE